LLQRQQHGVSSLTVVQHWLEPDRAAMLLCITPVSPCLLLCWRRPCLACSPVAALQVLLMDEITVDMDVLGRMGLAGVFQAGVRATLPLPSYMATHIFDGPEHWGLRIWRMWRTAS